MEEVRQLVQEEGREARNLVAFHVAVDSPSRVSRKPPRAAAAPAARRAPPRPAARLRSASAGRDKRSELRARYWALLFGDLQRSIGEIYNTVESHENLSECQEVILVLENYTRDFKALCEWFRLKWEYDNTPPPQRPQSLAWEIRKTDFVRPDSRRGQSVKSSPSVSGKNSPSLSGYNTPSGKNSPNHLSGKISPGSGKISPRTPSGIASPKGNVEFFSNKSAPKFTTKPEVKAAKESRLSDIKEKVYIDVSEDGDAKVEAEEVTIEIGKAKECPNVTPIPVVIKTKKLKANAQKKNDELSAHAKATIAKFVEPSFLEIQLIENAAKHDNMINQDKAVAHEAKQSNLNEKVDVQAVEAVKDSEVVEPVKDSAVASPYSSEDNFADVSNESSPVDVKIDSSNDVATNEEVTENNTGDVAKETPKTKDRVLEVSLNEESTKTPDNLNLVSEVNHNEETTETQTAKDLVSEVNQNETAIETPKAKDLVSEVKQDITPSQQVDDKTPGVNGDTTVPKDQDVKKTDSKLEVKPSRPAYSQAAAKPKLVSPKVETKPAVKTTPIVRSKTVVEMRPVSVAKTQNKYLKKNQQQTNKCSYPFNLTTGRTLFDFAPPPPNKLGIKKPVAIKIMQIATGDVKNKPDAKKLPPKRPSSLKVNEKGDDKSEKVNDQLNKLKDSDVYGSTDTVVAQIDMNRIESSESLKTLVPDELLADDVANSVEVLNVDGNKNDNDGWLTVKSRRLSRESKKQSKSHWLNRFNQPSATTSLPTLNMIESPKQEIKSVVYNTKLDRAKSEQPQTGAPAPKEKSVKVNVPKPRSVKKDTSMIRQKSDVTGLKQRSARQKKSEKAKEPENAENFGSELAKNRLHSSLESLSGLLRSQESIEDPFDFDKWKLEFKSYFKYLDEEDPMLNQNEILQSADPTEMSELAEMTSQIEENERKMALALDFQSEVDQRKLCEEEDLLNRQIMELQQVSDVDPDTETDETETDAEVPASDGPPPPALSQNGLGPAAVSLEDQYESALAGMTWAERLDTLVVLEELMARDPGRAQQLHAKLSTGKRRGSFKDALRRLQAKQARAEQQRLDLQTERSKRIHCLLTRVEEVKMAKNQLIEEKRLRMERRLKKAEENRNQHLKHIVRKAHDEEEKLREIAFIKQLEAENRRHDFLEQCRSHTTRLRQLRREHMLKLEQKAAREAAVGARRQALEEARRLHVEIMLEKRKERDARVEELKEQKKQERDDAAREKAEGVKSRLSALAAAAELEADALRSRIRDKQESTQQRLATHLQAIRTKATAPRQATTSESQEQNEDEEEEVQRISQEKKEKERQKAVKKRARKLRQKILLGGQIFAGIRDPELGPLPITNNKICKLLFQLNNILSSLIPPENKIQNGSIPNGVDSGIDIVVKSEVNLNEPKETNGIDNHVVTEKKKRKKKASSEEKQVILSKEAKNYSNSLKVAQNLSVEINENARKNCIETNNNDTNNKRRVETPEKEVTIIPNEPIKKSKANKKKADKIKEQDAATVDKPAKLSKTSSVASSMSDMSKVSGTKKEMERPAVNVDWVHLEKILTDMNRRMERIDKDVRAMFVHIMKALGQLFGVAGDREENGAQITNKSLMATAQAATRMLAMSPLAAAYFINSNGCAHAARLLSQQLEKDLEADKNELGLTKLLADCTAVALECVNATGLLHEKTRDDEDVPTVVGQRQRAHSIISYLCLSGCFSRAEHPGAVRDTLITLTTVCVDLCHPYEAENVPERLTALNCVRATLLGSVCGARAEFCQLFDRGAVLQVSSAHAEFARAARTAHLLQACAKLDHTIVQDAFGEGPWPLEFRAAVARLLTQHAPNDREAPRARSDWFTSRVDHKFSETIVLDLITLLGFVVVNNPQLQETICDGWSAVKILCTLPANWIVHKPNCHSLLPTLAALAQHPPAAAVIASELSLRMIEEYMASPEAQSIKLVQVINEGKKKRTAKK